MGVRATIGRSTGKYYWEYKLSGALGSTFLGIANINAALSGSGAQSNNARIYSGSRATNDIIGIALDLDEGTIEFYRNGVSQGIAFTDISLLGIPVFPFVANGASYSIPSITANFGATDFNYRIPGGYKSYDENQTTPNFLIMQNNKYYSAKNNILTNLGAPTDDTQKEQWFSDYGVGDLKESLLTPREDGSKLIDSLDNQFEVR
ncbi:SPRY domain-containing protein, partial [Clostridium sp. Mt-5]